MTCARVTASIGASATGGDPCDGAGDSVAAAGPSAGARGGEAATGAHLRRRRTGRPRSVPAGERIILSDMAGAWPKLQQGADHRVDMSSALPTPYPPCSRALGTRT